MADDNVTTGSAPAPVPNQTGETAAQVAPETSTPPPGEKPAPQPDPSATPKPKVDGRIKRINELTYQFRETQRQNERLLGIVERLQGAQTQEQAPKPEQFTTLDQYIKAMVAFESKQAQPKGKSEQDQADPEFAGAVADLRERGSEKYEDFEEKLENARFISPTMAQAVLESDSPEDVAYLLFTDQKEAKRIASLNPVRQATEIGRLEAKLSSQPPPKKPSAAPAPINPVGETGATEDNTIKPVMDYPAYLKAYRKRQAQKLK